jgi:hypothetical protein
MHRLTAKYTVDNDGLYTGCYCYLPNGMKVEVTSQKTPVYALCRHLDRLGYGDWHLSVTTPDGTPSLSCVVKQAATVTVIKNDPGSQRKHNPRPAAAVIHE